jgi:hypothetical protein
LITVSRAEPDALRAKADADPARVPTAHRDQDDPTEGFEPDGRNARGDFDRILKERETVLMKEIAARDQRVAELERACRDALRDRELATALAGKPLVPGAATQLIKLWRDDFDVYDEGGEYRVSAREGRTVSQAVADRLASAEYAHFCLPSSRGGAGAQDANRPVATIANAAPKNLGEAVLMHWRKEAASRPGDPSKPIGLGRRR